MKALLLIGGLGTRLRPVTETVPKQLIPIAGKAILYHTLDLLPDDIEEVVLSTGYKASVVAAYVRDHPFRLPLRTVPESTPLGSGGAMRFAGKEMSDPFFLLNTDVVAQADLSQVLQAHERHGGLGTMTLASVTETQWYGVAQLEGDRIVRFVEKPPPGNAPSSWINAGLAVWRSAVLDRIPPDRALSFEQEVVPGLLGEGVFGYRLTSYWEDAGTPERVLHAQRLLFDAGRAERPGLPPGAEGSPLVCSSDTVQATGASFGPYVTLEEEVRIGRGSRITGSVVMAGARIGRDVTIADSILGPNVEVSDGARVLRRAVAAGARI